MRISFLSPSVENTGDTGGKLNESAEASRGMCPYNGGVGSLLISVSREAGSEGYSAWGCHRWRR